MGELRVQVCNICDLYSDELQFHGIGSNNVSLFLKQALFSERYNMKLIWPLDYRNVGVAGERGISL